jgi:hypothetical protein
VKRFILAAPLLLTACGTGQPLPADSTATLDPIGFFTGESHGDATLHKLFSDDARVTVESRGKPDRNGLILDQTITEGTKPPRMRRWIIRPAGPHRFTGTLTDAKGPVDVTVNGPRADISYTMKNGLKVDQHLALQAGGDTVLNRLNISKFGIRVAHLDETIRKLD